MEPIKSGVGTINFLTVVISLSVAIITAIITSVVNWMIWKKQFVNEEKSEYRKLYNTRKLEIYEKIANCIGGEGLTLFVLFKSNKNAVIEDKEKFCKLVLGFHVKLKTLIIRNILFVGNEVRKAFIKKMEVILTEINSALEKDGVLSQDCEKRYIESIHSMQDAMAEELGIDKLIPGDKLLNVWELCKKKRKINSNESV